MANMTRPKNFSSPEDVILSTAYVNTSLDPIKGNDQKGGDFWYEVTEKYNSMIQEDESGIKGLLVRDTSSLYNCFKRQIQKDVVEFNGFLKYATANRKSGASDKDVFDNASDRMFDAKGKNFRFVPCLEVLKQMPIFCIDFVSSEKRKTGEGGGSCSSCFSQQQKTQAPYWQ